MANQELLDWIKLEKAQGYSEEALTKILLKQNYSKTEIQEAFSALKENNKTIPFSVYFALIMGIGFLSLILVASVILISTFSVYGKIGGYFFVLLTGVVIGYYVYHIKQKLNVSEKAGALLGVFTPTFPLFFILFSLTLMQEVNRQISILSSAGRNEGGFLDLLSIFGISLDPIIAGIIFFFFCNIFLIISIIKRKEYQSFLWYFLAPVLFLLLWFIATSFTSTIVTPTLVY